MSLLVKSKKSMKNMVIGCVYVYFFLQMAMYVSDFVTSGSLFVNPTDSIMSVADLDTLVIYMSCFTTSGAIYVNPCESWIQHGKVCCWLCICQFLQHMSIYMSNVVTGSSLYVSPC